MPLFRIQPLMPVQAYKTYAMSVPLATHWRPATCDEADCEAYRCGWVTTVDVSTDLGLKQYEYITRDKSRGHSMQRTSLTLVRFVFPPGTRCFRSDGHRLPLGRPAIWTVRGGDWRGATTQARVHKRAEDWAEDFAGHQDRLATAIGRG